MPDDGGWRRKLVDANNWVDLIAWLILFGSIIGIVLLNVLT